MMTDISRANSMLTTADNPFNPYTNWDEWYAWDTGNDYHTSAYLARIVKSSYELSDADQAAAIDDAIDEIIQLNPLGVYKRIGPTDTVEISN